MDTRIHERYADDPAARIAEQALRNCVHCGFCNATCPTYQELGDELDGPRGRIYLIKQVLEQGEADTATGRHLDRCLTCLNCMTTCPSGVNYAHLVEFGREAVERDVPRGWRERLLRAALKRALPAGWPFRLALGAGRLARPLLRGELRAKVPAALPAPPRPGRPAGAPVLQGGAVPFKHGRVLLLAGCVHDAIDARINAAFERLMAARGIAVERVSSARCCGAVEHHLSDAERTRARLHANLDAWAPALEQGVDAVVSTASGCGAMLRDYAHLLEGDDEYRERARELTALVRDPAELFDADTVTALGIEVADEDRRIAWHAPCTLQHGQGLAGRVEPLLRAAGCEVLPVAEGHLCCGSAGTYSITQPAMARQLRDRKLGNLEAAAPARIVSANIGCLSHLQSGTERGVEHWLSLLDRHRREG